MIPALQRRKAYHTLKHWHDVVLRNPVLQRTAVYQTLRHGRDLMRSPEYRAQDRIARANFRQFCDLDGGLGLRQNFVPRGEKPKTALIVRNISPPYAPIETFILKVLQIAGFSTVVVGKREYEYLRYDWLAGNKTGFNLSDYMDEGDPQWVDDQISRLNHLRAWLTLEYQGVHVGRSVIASTMRQTKLGQLNFSDKFIQDRLRQNLEISVSNTLAGVRLLDEIKPDCLLFLDRGYIGQAEICDLAIRQGIDTLTWNA